MERSLAEIKLYKCVLERVVPIVSNAQFPALPSKQVYLYLNHYMPSSGKIKICNRRAFRNGERSTRWPKVENKQNYKKGPTHSKIVLSNAIVTNPMCLFKSKLLQTNSIRNSLP